MSGTPAQLVKEVVAWAGRLDILVCSAAAFDRRPFEQIDEAAWHRMMTAQTAFMVARTLVNPQVYAAVGLDPREAKRTAFSNPHYQETLGWMGERVVGFLDEQGLIGPAERRIWRRSLLMRS